MILPLFKFACVDIGVNREQVLRWIVADVPYFDAGHTKFDKQVCYHIGNRSYIILLTDEKPPLELRVHAISALIVAANHADYCGMLMQDVFCALERRGLQPRFSEGLLLWQA